VGVSTLGKEIIQYIGEGGGGIFIEAGGGRKRNKPPSCKAQKNILTHLRTPQYKGIILKRKSIRGEKGIMVFTGKGAIATYQYK